MKPYIEEGMTVYGEIVGYVQGTDKFIQKGHDYGCTRGEWKFMPYRITTTSSDNRKYEWNVFEVDEWTRKLVKEQPELGKNVMFLEVLYHGKFADLYRRNGSDDLVQPVAHIDCNRPFAASLGCIYSDRQ